MSAATESTRNVEETMREDVMPKSARSDGAATNPDGAGPRRDRSRKGLTLACMCFALFMVMLDSTVVNLALKTIQVKLGATFSEVQWIVDAFVLALASLLLTGGTLGDLFGRRRAFISGLALFTGGSVLCALAPSTSFLIGARVVQGIGGALMLPSISANCRRCSARADCTTGEDGLSAAWTGAGSRR